MPTPSPGQTPGAPAAAALPAAAVVEVRGLWTVFGTGANAFAVHQDLDLTVQRGEILALVGGSVTGKTVLLRQMLGLDRPTRGSVTVLGRPAAEMGREGAASRVGMLFQHGALFSAFDVLGNVGFALQELGTLPPALVRDAALVKLQMVGLQPAHATRMPAEWEGGSAAAAGGWEEDNGGLGLVESDAQCNPARGGGPWPRARRPFGGLAQDCPG